MRRSLDSNQPASAPQHAVPVISFPRQPGVPPVRIERWTPDHAHGRAGEEFVQQRHAHDFLLLIYVEDGVGTMRLDGRDWPARTGDAIVVSPGTVIDPQPLLLSRPGDPANPPTGWIVFFPADAVDPSAPLALTSWRSHPLLFPFAQRRGPGGLALSVPGPDRPDWSRQLGELHDEMAHRRDGYADAVRALLTLLLVRLARLSPADDERWLHHEPVLSTVLDVIDARYCEPISLRDIASRVGLTPAHLTTMVRKRTGRTVQQWILQRRMRAARELLAETDLAVERIAERVGYRDAGYLARHFRREHGVTPAQWRRSART